MCHAHGFAWACESPNRSRPHMPTSNHGHGTHLSNVVSSSFFRRPCNASVATATKMIAPCSALSQAALTSQEHTRSGDCSQQQHAEQCADEFPAAAGNRRPAEHDGRDHRKFEIASEAPARPNRHSARLSAAPQARQSPHENEHTEHDRASAACPPAGPLLRLSRLHRRPGRPAVTHRQH